MAKPKNKIAKRGLGFVLSLFVYLFTIGVVLSALTFWWGAKQFNAPGPTTEATLFTVERGQGTNEIGGYLYGADLISDPFIFMIGTTIMGQHTALKAGEYEIQPQMSARDIMTLMSEGKTVARRVTVREGLTSFEVVQLLKGVEQLSGEIAVIPPEGSLLPNTYDYQLGEARGAVIARMSEDMSAVLDAAWDARSDDLPFKSKEEALVLASVIEKETAVADERQRVAGVFINRLKRGIPLQTDPTVIYAITKGEHKNAGKGPLGRRLLRKDLAYDSPYNTYKYPGLPPGPIANPGKASIEAALNPEAHDYIYFVADGTGGHAFSKTLREHNANAAKWRKIRREQSAK